MNPKYPRYQKFPCRPNFENRVVLVNSFARTGHVALTMSGDTQAAPAGVSPASRLLPSQNHPLGRLHMPHLAHLADRMTYPHLQDSTSPPSRALPQPRPRGPSLPHSRLVVPHRKRMSLRSSLPRHLYQHVYCPRKAMPPLPLKAPHWLGNVNLSEVQGSHRPPHARLD